MIDANMYGKEQYSRCNYIFKVPEIDTLNASRCMRVCTIALKNNYTLTQFSSCPSYLGHS